MATYDKEPAMFKDMWKNACESFEKQTGKRIDGESVMTLDDCKERIKNAQDGDEHDSKNERLKEYGMKALEYLKFLGGVVAEGAGMVFPPSTICFNAVAILLDIPQKLSKFWELVDSLFETLWPSLSTFEIYHKIRKKEFDAIEVELKRVIHKLLLSFVDICALSVNLRDSDRKRDKWAASAKRVLWNDDSGVEAAVERFKGLTKAHESIQSTQILKTGLEAKSGIDTLKASNDARIATEKRQTQLEKIREKLGVDEQVKMSTDSGKQISEQRTPHTAGWFENRERHSEYAKWADSMNSEARPILLVKGDKHTGKSVLLSAMAHSLQSAYKSPENASTRAFVAEFFFSTSMEKENEEKQPVGSAMKCIAYQLATQDKVYATNLHQSLESKPDIHRYLKDATPIELWGLLQIGSPKNKSTHYMIIDGIEGLSGHLQELFFDILASYHQPNRSTSRVALSIRSNTPIRPLKGLASEIDIQEHNRDDISTFIDCQLEEHDLFQEADDESRSMKERIRDTLTKEANGSFAKVKAAIDQINKVAEVDGQIFDVQQILEESNKDEGTISATVVRQLQESLTAEQIKEVNELLIWVVYGYEYFAVDELEAALFLRFRKRPILRLGKKLEGKYKPLFQLDQNGYAKVDEGILGTITKNRQEKRVAEESPKFTGVITITKGDLKSVQRFLWSLPQKLEYDSARFLELVDQGSVKGDIGVDKYDAHLAIVRSTFDLLKEPPNERTEAIARYLLCRLPAHLEELQKASGNNELTDAEKIEVGNGIYGVLIGNSLEIHWKSCPTFEFWLGDAKRIAILRLWLSDVTATSQLGPLDHEWLHGVENDINPNQALLARIMKFISRRWLRDTEWEVLKPSMWLREYFALPSTTLGPRKEESARETTESGRKATPAAYATPSIYATATRCKDLLDDDTEDALWYQRLGETFKRHGQHEDGIEASKKAIELGGPESTCLRNIAYCLAWNNKISDACVTMEKALVSMEKENQPGKPKITDIYFQLAQWHRRLKKFDRVIEYTDNAFQSSPEDGDVQFQALKIYLEIKQEALATQLLCRLLGLEGDQMISLPTLKGFIIRILSVDSGNQWYRVRIRDQLFIRSFVLLRRDAGAFKKFLCAIDEIINNGKDGARISALLLYKGVGLYFFSHDSARNAVTRHDAIVAWQRCLDKSDTREQTIERKQAMVMLSAHHFDHARAADQPDHRQRHLEEIKKLGDQSSPFPVSAPLAYLATYYHLEAEDPTEAREILRTSIKMAFDLLSDDIEENDSEAYYMLASVLIHLGDDTNAPIALSLRLPNPVDVDVMEKLLAFEQDGARAVGSELLKDLRSECEMRQPLDKQLAMALRILTRHESELECANDSDHGPHPEYRTVREALQEWSRQRVLVAGMYCDGCLRPWGFDLGFHQCTCCYDVCFCDDCVADVDNGRIEKLIVSSLACKPTHKRLYLPKLDREGLLMGFRGQVKMGDGTVVPASEWLEGLKREWGYGGTDGDVASAPVEEK